MTLLSEPAFLLGLLVFWVAGAVLAGVLSRKKNRNPVVWALGSFFISPLIIVVLIALSPLEADLNYNQGKFKICPFCGAQVKRKAVLCPVCKTNIERFFD